MTTETARRCRTRGRGTFGRAGPGRRERHDFDAVGRLQGAHEKRNVPVMPLQRHREGLFFHQIDNPLRPVRAQSQTWPSLIPVIISDAPTNQCNFALHPGRNVLDWGALR